MFAFSESCKYLWVIQSNLIKKKMVSCMETSSDLRKGQVKRTGELGYDRPLYDGFLHMTDDMLGPSPMHTKYSSYVYDGFCI